MQNHCNDASYFFLDGCTVSLTTTSLYFMFAFKNDKKDIAEHT